MMLTKFPMRNLPFLWLLLIYIFQIISCMKMLHVSGKCLADEELKLLQFRDGVQFSSPVGLNIAYPSRMMHWNKSRDCCSWDGIACDSFGHVISLQLDRERISVRNENWKSIFALEHIEHLNLADNYLYSANFPTELFNLTKLKYLDLSEAGFTGQIGIGLSGLKSLVTLDISSRFSGNLKIPDLKAALQNLTELRELNLDGVNISAQANYWCDALSSLSKLKVLSLIYCNLSGPIKSSLLMKLRSLTIIQLDGNNLATTSVDFFTNFPNLATLTLSFCNLQGQFPKKIFQVTTLVYLDLSGNGFIRGRLPQFPKNGFWRTILLSNTNVFGSLPDSIGNVRALSRIEMSNCSISGPIPSTMAFLSELVYVDLSYNKFNGSVPTFQMSKKLVFIDMSHNAFTGPISSAHFKGLRNLESINLGHNSLSGSIPSSLFILPTLQKLQLSNNQFDGHIDEFPNASSSVISVLDLSSNSLRGFIPSSFFELGRLVVLSLSFNFFSGTVKLEMFNAFHNLSSLDLSYNNLSIDASSRTSTNQSLLPQLKVLKLASCNLKMFPDLKNQSVMIHLDLSLNHMSGKIPNWIWEVGSEYLQHLNLSFNLLEDIQKPYTMPSSLLLLDLHANQLGGGISIPPQQVVYLDYSSNNFNISIPTNIGDYLFFASFISLSNNRITGPIPESICNASFLLVLDLSNNAFSGRIPACLMGMMENLGVLNLGGNKLHGLIPNTFQNNCVLRTLDLSMNALEGKMPSSLANCKQLQVLNVGKNNIEDTFPCTLMKESNLHVLVLRSNKFQGEIGCSWDNHSWSSLQIMDIAYNSFSGVLPPGLFLNWRGMTFEDGIPTSSSKFLQYEFLKLSGFYYHDKVSLIIKGVEHQLVKVLTIYKTIDFSCNKLHGEIPDSISELKALYIFNLSHNSLTGTIPEALGNLSQLGALDLSMNRLNGIIPLKLAGLTFLSFLNISFNQLFGEIPVGPQFQTFTDASFLGNRGLCGFPLNLSCDVNSKTDELSPISPAFESERDSAKNEIEWEYITAALGFTLGLGIIFWLNFSSPRWWQKFNALVLQLLLRILHQHVKLRSHKNPIRRL